MSETFRSPLKYLGGKFYLAKKITPLFPDHVCYCEVFCGAAHVLFAKPRNACEVINDINGELVNFWRVYSRFHEWFEYKLRYILYSRQEFEDLKALDPKSLSEEDRAWRYFYLNRCAFSGMMNRDSGCPRFGISKASQHSNHKSLFNVSETLKTSYTRFRNVIIENLPWQKCVSLYDAPDTFFYLDPPYENCESVYGKGIFSKEDFAALADTLAHIKGKFLLSINDSPFMREIFEGFSFLEKDVPYTVKVDGRLKEKTHTRKIGKELLVANYDLNVQPGLLESLSA